MTRQIVRLLVAGVLSVAVLAGCAATTPSAEQAPTAEPTRTTDADRPTPSRRAGHSPHPSSAPSDDEESAPAVGCASGPATKTPDPALDLPPVEVAVRFLDGRVEPAPDRVEVPLGSTVVLRAEVDTAAEIHVHGYDVMADAEPGEPVCLEVLADTPGVFDVEAHPETLLLQLAVR